MHFVQDAAQAFSELVHRRNPDFNKLGTRNSESVLSLMTGKSREYENQSSAPKHDREGTSISNFVSKLTFNIVCRL